MGSQWWPCLLGIHGPFLSHRILSSNHGPSSGIPVSSPSFAGRVGRGRRWGYSGLVSMLIVFTYG